MKPIETYWKGRMFRSRLEARWAVFFETTWIQWDYEPEGYMLRSGPYLPDFFLRLDTSPHEGAGYWVEVKPAGLPSERVMTRMRDLCVDTGHNGFVVAGNPWPGEFEFWKFSRRYDHRPRGGLVFHRPAHRTLEWPYVDPAWLLCTDVPWDCTEDAFAAAMSARFEHKARTVAGFTRAGDVLAELRRGPRIGRALNEAEARGQAEERLEGTEPA